MFAENSSIWEMVKHGGMTMVPLIVCSLIGWAVIFERSWRFYSLSRDLRSFHLEAMNALLRHEWDDVKKLCLKNEGLPTAELLRTAIDRLNAKDERLRANWLEAVERRRQILNQELRKNLWMLGTIGSAAPFIGLAGTVVGILGAFNEMARKGAGGFAVVAEGISSALVATAAGIIVAVIAVVAFNAFQTKWSGFVLLIKIQAEEFAEILSSSAPKA
ncbi:MAG: MotA/TolQ/ExbB proton channel family protein [Cryobacterium sp.]|nr:MotA/TolQ/ExbB proton channel family protein [Oligoflexia bacterium]